MRAGWSLSSVTIPNTALPEDETEGQLHTRALRDVHAVAAVSWPAAMPGWLDQHGMGRNATGMTEQPQPETETESALGSLKTMRTPWAFGRRGARSRSDVAMEPQLILLSTITRRRTIRRKEKGSGGAREMEIHLGRSHSAQPRHRTRADGARRSGLEL